MPACDNEYHIQHNRYSSIVGYHRNDTSDVMGRNVSRWWTVKILGPPEALAPKLDGSLLWSRQ